MRRYGPSDDEKKRKGVTCSNCGHQNTAEARFCVDCGAALENATSMSSENRGQFRRAFPWTAIPIVGLSIISTAGAAGGDPIHDPSVLTLAYFLWLVAALVWLAAFLVAIGFAIAGKRQMLSGMLAGIGIGIIALAATCFANLSDI